MLNILALETSTEACSAALLNADGELFSEFDLTPRQHTAYLPKMLDAVLQQANLLKSELSCIAYSNGPGAFTGVRIAASMAQGMAIGLGIPLQPVSTLAVLAQQACDEVDALEVNAALDARMGEVYVGRFQQDPASGLVQARSEESLLNLADLQLPIGVHLVGSGYRARHEAGLTDPAGALVFADIYPTARALVKLAAEKSSQGQQVPANAAGINYIRNQVAWKKNPQ